MYNREPFRRTHRTGQEAGLPGEEAPRPDGQDVIFDMELADEDDLTALARAEAADQRAAEKAGKQP